MFTAFFIGLQNILLKSMFTAFFNVYSIFQGFETSENYINNYFEKKKIRAFNWKHVQVTCTNLE